eukprot:gnl/TRDRNA2_/TRDRNA2_203827_c0_seq1.p1 gnl/TRDRNA2_/TRDRNA2_203827_c0~~gnl/TRDRNA2_/TRDRNA2_203827_c0_seq1.p1  ORF type:complete len:270 (-),score=12.68 gnl/TRDRNA2_/TRDRNA2_203827_c0_seq1:74-823(-)
MAVGTSWCVHAASDIVWKPLAQARWVGISHLHEQGIPGSTFRALYLRRCRLEKPEPTLPLPSLEQRLRNYRLLVELTADVEEVHGGIVISGLFSITASAIDRGDLVVSVLHDQVRELFLAVVDHLKKFKLSITLLRQGDGCMMSLCRNNTYSHMGEISDDDEAPIIMYFGTVQLGSLALRRILDREVFDDNYNGDHPRGDFPAQEFELDVQYAWTYLRLFMWRPGREDDEVKMEAENMLTLWEELGEWI